MKLPPLPSWTIVFPLVIFSVMVYIAAAMMLPAIEESNKTWDSQREEIAQDNDVYVKEHGGWDRRSRTWVSPEK